MFEKMKDILMMVAPQTKLSGLTMETRLSEDLGLNSMDMMLMALEIEDAFGIEFTGEESIKTVGDVCCMVQSQLNAA